MKKTTIIGLILFVLGVILTFIAFMLVDFKPMNFDTQGPFTTTSSVYEDITKDIVIDNAHGNIEIKQSLDNTIKIEVFSPKNDYAYDTSSNITVTQKDKDYFNFFKFGIILHSPKITLYIPSEYEGTIFIDNNAGEIDIENLQCKVLEIETNAGKIDLENSNITDSVIFRSDVGSINVENTTTNDFTITTNVGDIDIEHTIINSINFDAAIGDIDVQLIGNPNDYSIDANTTIGDVDIPNSTNGSKLINIITDTGDIDLEFSPQ